MAYGIEVYDENGVLVFDHTHDIVRVIYTELVTGPGNTIISGLYEDATPDILAFGFSKSGDLSSGTPAEMPVLVTTTKLGPNLYVEWDFPIATADTGWKIGDSYVYVLAY